MKNAMAAVLVFSGLGVWTLQGADFWKEKKYTEWDAEDVQKMLNDSPWARPVDIYLDRLAAPAAPGMSEAGGVRPPSSDMDESDAPGSMSDAEPAMNARTRVRLVVRFLTALPVKQAMARARYGAEAASSPAARQSFEAKEDMYVVAISGLPGMPPDPPALVNLASLKVKGKPAFPPQRVQADTRTLFLYFPREGHPIALKDREVEVQLRAPGYSIRRSFKLKDMVFNGKLEI